VVPAPVVVHVRVGVRVELRIVRLLRPVIKSPRWRHHSIVHRRLALRISRRVVVTRWKALVTTIRWKVWVSLGGLIETRLLARRSACIAVTRVLKVLGRASIVARVLWGRIVAVLHQ
jgi:hypothetical protein